MNDKPANINTPLEPNSDIIIEASTQGAPASCTLEQLDEYGASDMSVIVNGRIVRCPKFLEVNGSFEMPSYQIQSGDKIETRGFYTVGQVAEFMDVEVDWEHEVMVNNRTATPDTLIYENFTLDWTVLSFGAAAVPMEELPEADMETIRGGEVQESVKPEADEEVSAEAIDDAFTEGETEHTLPERNEIVVIINGQPVRLTGKSSYIFVDIFDFYEFDLKASAGRAIITLLNGSNAQFSAALSDGDEIELGWK